MALKLLEDANAGFLSGSDPDEVLVNVSGQRYYEVLEDVVDDIDGLTAKKLCVINDICFGL